MSVVLGREDAIRCVLEMGRAISYEAVGEVGEAEAWDETLAALRSLGVSAAELSHAGVSVAPN